MNNLYVWAKIHEARNRLAMLTLLDYPHAKEETRSRIFKGLHKAANPSIIKEDGKPLTTEDLARLING